MLLRFKISAVGFRSKLFKCCSSIRTASVIKSWLKLLCCLTVELVEFM